MSANLGSLVYHDREVGVRCSSAELLEDVTVNYESVIFRGGRIFPELFAPNAAHRAHWQRPSRYAWFLARNYAVRRGADRVESVLWVIDDMSPNSYYHWLGSRGTSGSHTPRSRVHWQTRSPDRSRTTPI